jgi:hypothetical protein
MEVLVTNNQKERKEKEKEIEFDSLITLDADNDLVGYRRELHYKTGSKSERKGKMPKVFSFPLTSGAFELTIGRFDIP